MINFIPLIIGSYIFILIGLYYFYSGKTLFPFFSGIPKGMYRFNAWGYILGGIFFQLFLLSLPLWSSESRIEFKIIITFLYVFSIGWLFYNTYQKYKVRIDKINQKQRGTK